MYLIANRFHRKIKRKLKKKKKTSEVLIHSKYFVIGRVQSNALSFVKLLC